MNNSIDTKFIHKLSSGNLDELNVVIEIPKASNVKYEVDKETGALFIDRKLFTAMFYPFNYGFIPSTLEDDGDPVDVLVLSDFSAFPLSVIKSIPVGVLLTEDEEGQDSKIIAIPIKKIDPTYSEIQTIENVSASIKKQIEHFFEHYKELEGGKYVKISGWGSKEEAVKKISDSIARFNKNNS